MSVSSDFLFKIKNVEKNLKNVKNVYKSDLNKNAINVYYIYAKWLEEDLCVLKSSSLTVPVSVPRQ